MTKEIKLERGVKKRVSELKRVHISLVGKVLSGDREDHHGILEAIIKENQKAKERKEAKKQRNQQLIKSLKTESCIPQSKSSLNSMVKP